jgi:hypothetical protein
MILLKIIRGSLRATWKSFEGRGLADADFDPFKPWSLTGVTAPLLRQSIEIGSGLETLNDIILLAGIWKLRNQ